jgi:ribosome-associated protein
VGVKVEGEAFAIEVARIAHDNRAEDVVVLDLRGLSSIADFFVVCTGTSDRQMRAVADYVEEFARRVGQKRFGISGYDAAQWILVDYVDIVVHIFDNARRHYYDLELMWGDAPRLVWERPGENATSVAAS